MSFLDMKLPEANAEFRPHSEAWDTLLTLLPPGPELERWARTTGALCRKRGVKGAPQLLRVALCYGFCNLSLEVASAWASVSGTARLGAKAVLKRLRNCGEWLEWVLAEMLGRRLPPLASVAGLRVQLVDTTRVSCPGSKGQSWRIHAAYDPWECRLIQLSLSDNSGGERLDRFRARPNDLLVADRGYAHRRGLAKVRAEGGHFLVRTGWNRVPLQTPDGHEFGLFEHLRSLQEGDVSEWAVRTEPDERHGIPAVPCRLVVRKQTDAQTEQARRKMKAEANRKNHKLDERTLEAAGYMLVLTSVEPERLDAGRVLELYRMRWQIELKFKRMKSILDVDAIAAKDPGLVRAVLAAKLIGTLLVEDCVAASARGNSFRRKQWPLTWLADKAVQFAIFGRQAAEGWLSSNLLSQLNPSDQYRKRQPQMCLAAASLS